MLVYYSGYGQWCERRIGPNDSFGIARFRELSEIIGVSGIFNLPEHCQSEILFTGHTNTSYLLPCISHVKAVIPSSAYKNKHIVFVLKRINDDEDVERFSVMETKLTKTDIIHAEENMSPDVEDTSDKVVKPHGNAKHNSANRQKILGAALSVLATWPDLCKTKTGKVEATKIATLIDEKSGLFWCESETGDAPLAHETSVVLIRKWLKKTK